MDLSTLMVVAFWIVVWMAIRAERRAMSFDHNRQVANANDNPSLQWAIAPCPECGAHAEDECKGDRYCAAVFNESGVSIQPIEGR